MKNSNCIQADFFLNIDLPQAMIAIKERRYNKILFTLQHCANAMAKHQA